MLILCRAHSILQICTQHTVILNFYLQHTAAHKKTSLPLQKTGPPSALSFSFLLPHPVPLSPCPRSACLRRARTGSGACSLPRLSLSPTPLLPPSPVPLPSSRPSLSLALRGAGASPAPFAGRRRELALSTAEDGARGRPGSRSTAGAAAAMARGPPPQSRRPRTPASLLRPSSPAALLVPAFLVLAGRNSGGACAGGGRRSRGTIPPSRHGRRTPALRPRAAAAAARRGGGTEQRRPSCSGKQGRRPWSSLRAAARPPSASPHLAGPRRRGEQGRRGRGVAASRAGRLWCGGARGFGASRGEEERERADGWARFLQGQRSLFMCCGVLETKI